MATIRANVTITSLASTRRRYEAKSESEGTKLDGSKWRGHARLLAEFDDDRQYEHGLAIEARDQVAQSKTADQ